MSKSLVALAVLAAASFPSGTVGGALVFDLHKADDLTTLIATKQVEAPGTSATFEAVEPGTHVVVSYRVDATGEILGTPVESAAFDVIDGPVTVSIDVPASVTVTVA